jgi:ethanolamine utilization microcompartment shell protein EutL
MDKVFLVYVNADSTEGRGPMAQAPDSGFFTDEDEAYKFADTLPGVFGRKPEKGTWRGSSMGDVQVITILKHSDKIAKKKVIQAQIKKLENELAKL